MRIHLLRKRKWEERVRPIKLEGKRHSYTRYVRLVSEYRFIVEIANEAKMFETELTALPEKAESLRESAAFRKFTVEREIAFFDAIDKGAHVPVACKFAGINERTLAAWIQRGVEERKGKYWNFAKELRLRLANVEVTLCGRIMEGTKNEKNGGKLALDLVKARFPDRWAKGKEVAVKNNTANQTNILQINMQAAEQLPITDRKQLLAKLQHLAGVPPRIVDMPEIDEEKRQKEAAGWLLEIAETPVEDLSYIQLKL